MDNNKVRDTKMLNERKRLACGWLHGRPIEDLIEECFRAHVGDRGLVLDSFEEFITEEQGSIKGSIKFHINVLKATDPYSMGLSEVDPEFSQCYLEIFSDGAHKPCAPVRRYAGPYGAYNNDGYNQAGYNYDGYRSSAFNRGVLARIKKPKLSTTLLSIVMIGGIVHLGDIKKENKQLKSSFEKASANLDAAVGDLKVYDNAIKTAGYRITQEGKLEKK